MLSMDTSPLSYFTSACTSLSSTQRGTSYKNTVSSSASPRAGFTEPLEEYPASPPSPRGWSVFSFFTRTPEPFSSGKDDAAQMAASDSEYSPSCTLYLDATCRANLAPLSKKTRGGGVIYNTLESWTHVLLCSCHRIHLQYHFTLVELYPWKTRGGT